MAAGDQISLHSPPSLSPQNGLAWPTPLVQSNGMACAPLMKNGNPYFFKTRIPASATVSTGLTFAFEVTDDGKNSNDLGKVIVVGVTVKKLTSGTDTYDITASAATEATASVTLNAATGVAVASSVAIANAALDSAGAGDRILVQIRRVGTSTSDTCNGTALLSDVVVINT
jgi:hypothetical protein